MYHFLMESNSFHIYSEEIVNVLKEEPLSIHPTVEKHKMGGLVK